MLADVVKEREIERQRLYQAEVDKYNKLYKRDTIIYFNTIHTIGGIETWIYNLGKRYEFSVVYDRADEEQLKRLNDIGIETIKNVGQQIECDTLLFMLHDNNANIKANKKYLFIHGLYNNKKEVGNIPEYDEIYACSKVASEYFEKATGIKPKVMYNIIDTEIKEEPLILGVFSRLSKEKGKNRIIYLLDKLNEQNKPYLMLIFTDLPFDYPDNRVIFIKPTLDIMGWIKKCDYVVQLSDTEAGSYTLQESLKMGIPLITTKLDILKEFNIDHSNAKILDYDMSNLDINDLWNKPVVKDWKEPRSKEWEVIMKKKVLRERNLVKPEVKAEVKEVKTEPKEEKKKVKK